MSDSPTKEDSDSVPQGAPWLPISAQADYAVTVLFKACPRGPKAMALQACLYLEMWALAARGGRELGTTVHKQKTVSIYHWPPFSLRKKYLEEEEEEGSVLVLTHLVPWSH